MKLIIQIPCHNEEHTLGRVLSELPRKLDGVESVEWLVIDDGSTDKTSVVAAAHGADHIVRLPRRSGLSRAFLAGLDASVRAGADIIVNTDGDHQYCGSDIPALVRPILERRADMVIGARPVQATAHFSRSKKLLQSLGSWVTRVASQTDVADAPSGFRALTRELAMQIHVFNAYTYTVETIIQAGRKGMRIVSVPVRTNPELRPSRLVHGIGPYVARQILTIVRVVMTYRPFRFFAVPGALAFAAGFAIGLRFTYYYLTDGGAGHIQSLILAALLMGIGFFLVIIGLVADLLAVNRSLLEEVEWRVRHLETVLPMSAAPPAHTPREPSTSSRG